MSTVEAANWNCISVNVALVPGSGGIGRADSVLPASLLHTFICSAEPFSRSSSAWQRDIPSSTLAAHRSSLGVRKESVSRSLASWGDEIFEVNILWSIR